MLMAAQITPCGARIKGSASISVRQGSKRIVGKCFSFPANRLTVPSQPMICCQKGLDTLDVVVAKHEDEISCPVVLACPEDLLS
jgi:hypothetical protein